MAKLIAFPRNVEKEQQEQKQQLGPKKASVANSNKVPLNERRIEELKVTGETYYVRC
jgi:hypothetical protein